MGADDVEKRNDDKNEKRIGIAWGSASTNHVYLRKMTFSLVRLRSENAVARVSATIFCEIETKA